MSGTALVRYLPETDVAAVTDPEQTAHAYDHDHDSWTLCGQKIVYRNESKRAGGFSRQVNCAILKKDPRGVVAPGGLVAETNSNWIDVS